MYLVGGWDLGSNPKQALTLVVIAVALLHMFVIPIFKIIGLPQEGISFLFLNFALTLVILYILPMFLPGFLIKETDLAELRIFGFVLPSRHLTPTWTAVYSALVISLVFHVFGWLFNKD
jgi:hypothetical protein